MNIQLFPALQVLYLRKGNGYVHFHKGYKLTVLPYILKSSLSLQDEGRIHSKQLFHSSVIYAQYVTQHHLKTTEIFIL